MAGDEEDRRPGVHQVRDAGGHGRLAGAHLGHDDDLLVLAQGARAGGDHVALHGQQAGLLHAGQPLAVHVLARGRPLRRRRFAVEGLVALGDVGVERRAVLGQQGLERLGVVVQDLVRPVGLEDVQVADEGFRHLGGVGVGAALLQDVAVGVLHRLDLGGGAAQDELAQVHHRRGAGADHGGHVAGLELDDRLELDRLVRVVVALVRVGRLRAVLGVEGEQVVAGGHLVAEGVLLGVDGRVGDRVGARPAPGRWPAGASVPAATISAAMSSLPFWGRSRFTPKRITCLNLGNSLSTTE